MIEMLINLIRLSEKYSILKVKIIYKIENIRNYLINELNNYEVKKYKKPLSFESHLNGKQENEHNESKKKLNFSLFYNDQINNITKLIFNYFQYKILEDAEIYSNQLLYIDNFNNLKEKQKSNFKFKIIELIDNDFAEKNLFDNFEFLKHLQQNETTLPIDKVKNKILSKMRRYSNQINYQLKIENNCFPIKRKFVNENFTEELKTGESDYLDLDNFLFYNSEKSFSMEEINTFCENNNVLGIFNQLNVFRDSDNGNITKEFKINKEHTDHIEDSEKIEYFLHKFFLKNKLKVLFCIGNCIESNIKEIFLQNDIQIFDWLTYENFKVKILLKNK